MSELRLTLFGAPVLTLAGSPLKFDTRKAVALLAYLATTGRSQRRESLAALLWPESDQTRARAALRRTLSSAGAAGPALQIRRDEVELDPTLSWSDVTEFEQLAVSTTDEDLRRAAQLAPDRFLAGFSLRDSAAFDEWSLATAERLNGRLTTVLSQLTERHIAAARWADAIETANQRLDLDPLSEGAHRDLMRLYAWTGERPLALKQYRACVRTLVRDLGVAPLAETTELYDDIRANRLDPPTAASAASRSTAGTTTSPQVPREPPTLIGRENERRALRLAWERAAHGGHGALLTAAPGLGRTALAEHLRTEVERAGGATIALRGHAAEVALPYATIVDLTKALVARAPTVAGSLSAIGQSVESPGERVRIFELVRDATSATLSGSLPGLLLIDDAQWIDPTSGDLLGYLLRRPPEGVLVLATVTDDDRAADVDKASSIVSLRPWSRAETTAALEALGAGDVDPAEAFRRTGGNPRLVVEFVLASSQTDGTPSGELADIVGLRLDRTAPATRQILGAVAVIGTVTDPELIRLVSGRDEVETVQSIEDAVSRGLLVERVEEGGYDFPHDVLRSMVLERIGLARLRLLNSRAADALNRSIGSRSHAVPAARVAQHLERAGRESEAQERYWTSGQEAMRLYAHREALEHLRSALALGSDPAVTNAAIGDCLTALGRYDDALVAYEQAAAATPARSPHELAVIEHKLAEVHDRLGDWQIARAHLESADELLRGSGSVATRAQVLADLALISYRQGDAADAAERLGQEALALATSSQDALSMSQATNVLGVLAAAKGRCDEAKALLTDSREHARSAGDVELEVAALNNLARLHAQEGSVDPALTAAQEALELGLAQGDLHRVAALHDHVADLLHQAGRQDEAIAHLKAAATAFSQVDEARVRPEVWKLVSW